VTWRWLIGWWDDIRQPGLRLSPGLSLKITDYCADLPGAEGHWQRLTHAQAAEFIQAP
jgi:hypothetical protein